MRPEAAKLLWDAREAARLALTFVGKRSLDDYLADPMLRSAVERQLAIIGEALGKLRALDANAASHLPEHARIIAFRNVLVHGYATVDDRLVWGIVATLLPGLRDTIATLLPDD